MGRPGFGLSRRLAQRKVRASAQPRPSFWHHLDAVLGRVRSLAVSTTLLLALGLLGWAIGGELWRNPVIIEPLLVPDSVAEDGWTGEVLARHMRDQIRDINEGAKTQRGRDQYMFDREQVDIVLPGGLVSVRTLVTVVRAALDRPARRVTAEVIVFSEREERPAECDPKFGAHPRYVLVGHLSNPARSWTTCSDAVQGLPKLAADGLMLATKPYVLASYQVDHDATKAKDIITKSILTAKNARDDYPLALSLLGYLRYKEGDFDGAIYEYRQATRLDPNLAVAYNNWGNALSALKRLREATDMYEKATRCDPNQAFVWWNWGNALSDLSEARMAIDKYDTAIQLDPNFAWAYNNWGSALLDLKRTNDAIDKYERATRLDPSYVHAYKNWGDALLEQQKYILAAEKYKEATKLDPNYAGAYIGWSKALSALNQSQEAKDMRHQAIQAIKLCLSTGGSEESCNRGERANQFNRLDLVE